MKRRIITIAVVAMAALFSACTDAWDSHYNNSKAKESEDLSVNLYEYLENNEEFSSFFDLIKSTKLSDTTSVADELNRDQYLTVWAVRNSNFDMSNIGIMEPEMVAKYHVNYLAIGASNLAAGLRIQTVGGVYITIKQVDGVFYANKSRILSTTRTKNGVVHEIETVLVPQVNMFDYVTMLPDEYSIIRDSIINYNVNEFDAGNSTPIGVDETGNTIYDSVFTVNNPLFETANIRSEFEQYTMFLPNNDVVNATIAKMKSQYETMGKSFGSADSTLAFTWIKEAIFHSGQISNYTETLDLKSVSSRVWRTSVQKIDELNPIELSNGIAYNVTEMKIPNNVFVTRIKSLVHYYEHLDSIQKSNYYNVIGAISNPEVVNAGGTANPTVLPYYWCLQASGSDTIEGEFSIEFAPISLDTLPDGTIEAKEMQVPCGEYNFYMGFWSMGHPYVDIYLQSGTDHITSEDALVASEVNVSASSPWNFDRVNDVDPNIKKWNGSGGLVGVVNIEGEGMGTFRVKVKFNKLLTSDGKKRLSLYHWALKPTSNNY